MLLPTMLEQNPGVAGGISMAGTTRSLFDVTYDQYEDSLEAGTQTPVETALSVQVPLLFLQGDADIQVSLTKDFEVWNTALANRPDTTFCNYPKLNHLSMPTTGRCHLPSTTRQRKQFAEVGPADLLRQ